MTQRERFLKTAAFDNPDRTFLLKPWFWRETLERFREEGLPDDADICGYFGTDKGILSLKKRGSVCFLSCVEFRGN